MMPYGSAVGNFFFRGFGLDLSSESPFHSP